MFAFLYSCCICIVYVQSLLTLLYALQSFVVKQNVMGNVIVSFSFLNKGRCG